MTGLDVVVSGCWIGFKKVRNEEGKGYDEELEM
jgi:hypothetical protein